MTMRTDNKSESHLEVIILLDKPMVQRGLTDFQSLTMLTPSRLSRPMSLMTTNMGNHGWKAFDNGARRIHEVPHQYLAR